MKLSIVIPCYNEAKNIPLILEKFQQIIEQNNIEIILVNNGSIDNSEVILQQLLPQYSFAKSIRVEKNQGYGFGILAGLHAATGDFLGWTHADMQVDPYEIIKAYRLLQEKKFDSKTFIKGRRKGRSLFDQIFTIGMSSFESLYLGMPLWDINGQPTIFHKDFFATWRNAPHDFSLDLYAYYKAKKLELNIIRFDIIFAKRLHGQASNESFSAKWKLTKRTLSFSRQLKRGLVEIHSS